METAGKEAEAWRDYVDQRLHMMKHSYNCSVSIFVVLQVLFLIWQGDTWKQLAKKLKPGGRIWANMADDQQVAKAIAQAFPGECSMSGLSVQSL